MTQPSVRPRCPRLRRWRRSHFQRRHARRPAGGGPHVYGARVAVGLRPAAVAVDGENSVGGRRPPQASVGTGRARRRRVAAVGAPRGGRDSVHPPVAGATAACPDTAARRHSGGETRASAMAAPLATSRRPG
eukprot:TRINITY_DN5502_c0_g1_i1.p4 TRINITY_DN5502_c0_g1~~TRINITY_DN5502_c0_g1_i1.p4  ORF type:complete len:132 (-),score=9.55 TRINITY_DN5502_c0_g1_i1:401-796(-)